MAEYIVTVDNRESNTDNLSITGKVNGTQCAAVIKLSALDGLSKKAQDALQHKALIQAFLNRQQAIPESAGVKVSYGD